MIGGFEVDGDRWTWVDGRAPGSGRARVAVPVGLGFGLTMIFNEARHGGSRSSESATGVTGSAWDGLGKFRSSWSGGLSSDLR